MSTMREGSQKWKAETEPKAVSWQDKKSSADKEEEVLQKEIEDLRRWVLSVLSLQFQFRLYMTLPIQNLFCKLRESEQGSNISFGTLYLV